MKMIMSTAIALLMCATVVGFAPAYATPPASLECTGTVVGTYADDGDKPTTYDYHSVTVPEGESCVLKNVSVKHNVKALHGSVDVKVLDSYVGGNVHVKGATGIVHIGQKKCAFDPTVRVNVLVYDSHNVLICYVDAHNIQVKRNDGRITLRDNVAHRIDVSKNKEYAAQDGDPAHRNPGTIRLFENTAERHIHVFNNHESRDIKLRGNTPEPIVK